jgi:hypothetical protein
MEKFTNWLKQIDLLYHATGFTVIIAFLATVFTILYREIPKGNEQLFAHLLGMVEGSFVGGLCAYFFVKSKKEKDPGSN